MGHGGMEHLASCWATSTFWECGSIQALERVCWGTISLTSGMGTDSGIRGLRVKTVEDVLPEWLRSTQLGEIQLEPDPASEMDHDHVDVGPAGMQQPPTRCLLHMAIEAPGPLHIRTNPPKDLKRKLSHWREHFEKLRCIKPLLTERYHRERLRATVLKGSPLITEQFEKLSGDLYEQRWKSVLQNRFP